MDEKKFQSLMSEAETMKRLSNDGSYYSGYERGLRRLHHGEAFGTEAEHETYLGIDTKDPDMSRARRGRGYRDGLNGIRPNLERWSYCTQNDNECPTCSLVNYGRDCLNNPL